MIIPEEKLLAVAEKFNISCIKIKNHNFDELVVVDVDSIEAFFNQVTLLQEKVVFYIYLYNEKDDYLISNELFDYEVEGILSRVEEHNKRVEKINFDLPKTLYICTLKNGMPIICKFSNDPVKDYGIKLNYEAIELIEEEFYKEDDENANDKLERLKEYILENATDIDMRNADLRYEFLANLVAANGKFEGYDRYFDRYFGTSRRGTAKNFMDKLKYEYDKLKKS